MRKEKKLCFDRSKFRNSHPQGQNHWHFTLYPRFMSEQSIDTIKCLFSVLVHCENQNSVLGWGSQRSRALAVNPIRQCKVWALIYDELTLFCVEVRGGPACSSRASSTILHSTGAYLCPASIWQPATLLLKSFSKNVDSLILPVIAFPITVSGPRIRTLSKLKWEQSWLRGQCLCAVCIKHIYILLFQQRRW